MHRMGNIFSLVFLGKHHKSVAKDKVSQSDVVRFNNLYNAGAVLCKGMIRYLQEQSICTLIASTSATMRSNHLI